MLIRIIIISMLLFSCSFKGKQRDYIPKENNTPIVSTKQIYNYNQEQFGVSINYNIPYNNFVFYRQENSFKASLSMTMQIYDINNDTILTQESWLEDIIVNSYEITRSFEEQYEFDKIINLFSGEYELLINVEDLDNNNVISAKKLLSLSALDGFGEFIVYGKQEESSVDFKVLDSNISLINKNIRVSFQFFSDDNDNTIDVLNLDIVNNKNSSTQSYEKLELDDNGFYVIDLTIPPEYYGEINLVLSTSTHSKTHTLFNYSNDIILWSDDIREIIGLMRYILPSSDMKLLNGMKDEEKIDYIINFWKDKDPDTTTEKNELLNEFINRFHFVNLNLSDIGEGWRSDRGRIYIIYGEPEAINRYSNAEDGIFEEWTYLSGLKFTFLDRNRFGNFILIRQSL